MRIPAVVLRNFVYPCYFYARRIPVYRYLRDLRALQRSNYESINDLQLRLINRILKSAALLPEYRRLYDIHGPGEIQLRSLDELSQLPPIDKQFVRKLAKRLYDRKTFLRAISIRQSGGSTGVPVTVLADGPAIAAALSARMLCESWYGIKTGNRQVRFWGRANSENKIKRNLRNMVLNRLVLSAESMTSPDFGNTIREIRRFDPEYFYGYSSLILLFLDKLRRRDELAPLNLRAIVSTSEVIFDSQRSSLSQRFDCPVVDEYGCSEVDIISYMCPSGGRHIVEPNVYLEIKQFGGEPKGLGEVVVTDLRNRFMPLIRYRLGDLVSTEMSFCECGIEWRCHRAIKGRVQNQFVILPDGSMVHSQNLVYIIEKLVTAQYPIAQFVFVQGKNYNIVLYLALSQGTAVDEKEFKSKVSREFRHVLKNIEIRTEIVGADIVENFRKNKHRHFLTLIDS